MLLSVMNHYCFIESFREINANRLKVKSPCAIRAKIAQVLSTIFVQSYGLSNARFEYIY